MIMKWTDHDNEYDPLLEQQDPSQLFISNRRGSVFKTEASLKLD